MKALMVGLGLEPGVAGWKVAPIIPQMFYRTLHTLVRTYQPV